MATWTVMQNGFALNAKLKIKKEMRNARIAKRLENCWSLQTQSSKDNHNTKFTQHFKSKRKSRIGIYYQENGLQNGMSSQLGLLG